LRPNDYTVLKKQTKKTVTCHFITSCIKPTISKPYAIIVYRQCYHEKVLFGIIVSDLFLGNTRTSRQR
jgi:hypothetical protein